VPPNLGARAAPPAAGRQPLRLGPTAPPRSSGEDDLWRIVAFDDADASRDAPGGPNASFEAAFQQVDAHLESLVHSEVSRPAGPRGAPSPSPATVPAAPAQTSPAQSAGTEDDDWSFNEADLEGDPSDEAAKLRRQRLLQRAMQSMGSLPAPTGSVSPQGAPSTSGERAPLSPEMQQLAQDIEQRHSAVLAKRDHFTLLGLAVDPSVSRDQVKAAFLGLAKRFHPDRLPPPLAHLAPKMNAVFEAIRGAYEVLYDDARRAAYLQSLRRGAEQGSPRPVGDPNDLFTMGEVFFRKRDFSAAIEQYERAFAIEPRPVYLAARAWAIYMDPQRKADAPMAKQMMTEALNLDPHCDRAHYQLGVIARVEGDMARAERHFREAVRVNPKHLEANQELRLIEMRKRNPPQKKGGFFR